MATAKKKAQAPRRSKKPKNPLETPTSLTMGAAAVTPTRATGDFKHFHFVMAAFVTVLICSNLIGPAKQVALWGFTFGAGVLFFPFSYIFGDVLTEVYGYARSRQVIWAGFAGLAFASFMAWVVVDLFPAAPGWAGQAALKETLGGTWRIVLASLIAFWAGEFVNSFVLAKMKIATSGRFLWMRTIGSTIVGQAVDSAVFYPIAFWGTWSPQQVFAVMFSNYLIKTAWEMTMTPVTYRVVSFLKKAEGIDTFDRGTAFTPFSLKNR